MALLLAQAMADTCGFVYIIVLIEKSARKIDNTSQTENFRVFFLYEVCYQRYNMVLKNKNF